MRHRNHGLRKLCGCPRSSTRRTFARFSKSTTASFNAKEER